MVADLLLCEEAHERVNHLQVLRFAQVVKTGLLIEVAFEGHLKKVLLDLLDPLDDLFEQLVGAHAGSQVQ